MYIYMNIHVHICGLSIFVSENARSSQKKKVWFGSWAWSMQACTSWFVDKRNKNRPGEQIRMYIRRVTSSSTSGDEQIGSVWSEEGTFSNEHMNKQQSHISRVISTRLVWHLTGGLLTASPCCALLSRRAFMGTDWYLCNSNGHEHASIHVFVLPILWNNTGSNLGLMWRGGKHL